MRQTDELLTYERLSFRAVGRVPLKKNVQKSICDYLDYRKHFCLRNNTGAYTTEHGGLIRYGAKGSLDITLVSVGRPYFPEVKRPGTYQSADQKKFQRQAEAASALYAVVRSIYDVQQLGL
jgi:hypothetical protein